MVTTVHEISQISSNSMQWNLKVRVVRMWELPDRFNPGKPYSIELILQYAKGKARVHKKTASALCLTTLKNEDKMEFSRILEAIKANFNDKYEENRKKWGGGVMGSKSQARTKAEERVLTKEAAQRMN